MFFRFDRERKKVVKFAEESNDSAKKNEGPFFPNLQLLFKNRQQDPSNLSEEKIINSIRSSKTVAREEEEEDIDMEANEYIKRKHHELYLQKLMSMNAASKSN